MFFPPPPLWFCPLSSFEHIFLTYYIAFLVVLKWSSGLITLKQIDIKVPKSI